MTVDDLAKRLPADARLAAKTLADTGVFPTGQSILTECADAIEALTARAEAAEARVATSRNKALEDAAKVAEGFNPSPLPLVEYRTSNIAAAIRALKSDLERG